jgi:hypothetical protein
MRNWQTNSPQDSVAGNKDVAPAVLNLANDPFRPELPMVRLSAVTNGHERVPQTDPW